MELPPNVVVDLVTAESGDVVSYNAFYPPIEVNAVETPVILYSTETVGASGTPGSAGAAGQSAISYCADTPVPPIGGSVSVTYDTVDWMMLGLPVAGGDNQTGEMVGSFVITAVDKPSRTAVLLRTA